MNVEGGCPLKVALNHLLLFFMETSKLGENIQTSHRNNNTQHIANKMEQHITLVQRDEATVQAASE